MLLTASYRRILTECNKSTTLMNMCSGFYPEIYAVQLHKFMVIYVWAETLVMAFLSPRACIYTLAGFHNRCSTSLRASINSSHAPGYVATSPNCFHSPHNDSSFAALATWRRASFALRKSTRDCSNFVMKLDWRTIFPSRSSIRILKLFISANVCVSIILSPRPRFRNSNVVSSNTNAPYCEFASPHSWFAPR